MTVERLATADVVHLCFRPPDEPGSYNALVGALVHHPGELRQVAVCYSERPAATPDDRVLLVGPAAPGARAVTGLRLPERLRAAAFEGMGSRERIAYALQVADLLRRRSPPVVVVWDDYKLGGFLRRQVSLPSSLVLSQHGRSYHLPSASAREVYRLEAYDAVVTLSRASYRADRDRVYAYEPLVLVRPNGVDPDRFPPVGPTERSRARGRWGLPGDAPVVLALARLAPSKGAHLLVHSWPRVLSEVPDALLWVVGAGDEDYRDRLARQVDRLHLSDHIRLEGAVDRDQVSSCLAAADLYTFPSVQDEGHPLSLLEAMAAGLPCVAADSPVVRELHQDAVALVPDPGVEDAFVAPVVGLLQDDEARAHLGRAARAQVEQRYRLDTYLQELTAFLARLAVTRSGR